MRLAIPVIVILASTHVHSQSTNFNISKNDHTANHEILGIINGQEVPEGKYPFMVSLQVGDTPCKEAGFHFCSGTIINDNTIMTAAHCFSNKDARNLAVVLNKTHWDREGFCHQVSKLVTHPDSSSDIGIIKLATPIDFEKMGSHVVTRKMFFKLLKNYFSFQASPVCLPPRRDDPVNTQCIVMGWGKIEGGKNANHLRERTVTKVERRTFGHKASEEGMFYEVDEPTTCGGDAGGPLLCPVEGNEEVLLQFGIIAWFYDTDTPVGDDCTGGGASFSNVAPFIAWIKKIADE